MRSWAAAEVPPPQHGNLVIDHAPASTLKGWSDPKAPPVANRRHLHTAELGHDAL
jgi:hypothetical protein